MNRATREKSAFDKSKLLHYGLYLIVFMALMAIAMGLIIDDMPRFGFTAQ